MHQMITISIQQKALLLSLIMECVWGLQYVRHILYCVCSPLNNGDANSYRGCRWRWIGDQGLQLGENPKKVEGNLYKMHWKEPRKDEAGYTAVFKNVSFLFRSS